MEQEIHKRFGVRNEGEHKRKARVRSKHNLDHPGPALPSPGHIHQALLRLTQRTVEFIRWLRNHPDQQRDWPAAIARLVAIHARL
jgi:hypothetical protein